LRDTTLETRTVLFNLMRKIPVFALSMMFCASAFGRAKLDMPLNYSDAQKQIREQSANARQLHENIKKQVNLQAENLEVKRRIEQAKAKIEQVIRRDNAAKACKMTELADTSELITITTGTAIQAKEGGKAALKWLVRPPGLEASDVNSASDTVRIGIYTINKISMDELGGGLSSGNLERLRKLKDLIEDETSGKNLKKKLGYLQDELEKTEDSINKTDLQLAGLSADLVRTKGRADYLEIQSEILRAGDEKNFKEQARKLKALKNTAATPEIGVKAAAMPAPQYAPNDSAQEKKRKLQDTINKYIALLQDKVRNGEKTAAEIYGATNGIPNYSDLENSLNGYYSELGELEENLESADTYLRNYGIQKDADSQLSRLEAERSKLQSAKENVENKVGFVLKEQVYGPLAEWEFMYSSYTAQGFSVPAPLYHKAEVKAWKDYYSRPITYIDNMLSGTEEIQSDLKDISSRARTAKDTTFSDAKKLTALYMTQFKDFTDYRKELGARLEEINRQASAASKSILNLPSDFQNEFSANGKGDLSDLRAKLDAAKLDFARLIKLSSEAGKLHDEAVARNSALSDIGGDRLIQEARSILYSGEEPQMKVMKDLGLANSAGRLLEPGLEGLEQYKEIDSARLTASDIIFAGEEALRYLEDANGRMLAVVSNAEYSLNANLSEDLYYLEKAKPQKYAEGIASIFKPSYEVDDKLREIRDEVRSVPFFEPKEELKPRQLKFISSPWGPMLDGKTPLFWQTDFSTRELLRKKAELLKISADFWNSPAGRGLTEARKTSDMPRSLETNDPGAAAIKKMYDDFKKAYEDRNTVKMISLFSNDWSAGDGSAYKDLGAQFIRIFKLFDDISLDITGLRVDGAGNGVYTASYDIAIRGKIYKTNTTSQLNSSVREYLEIAEKEVRIKKTESGSYWNLK